MYLVTVVPFILILTVCTVLNLPLIHVLQYDRNLVQDKIYQSVQSRCIPIQENQSTPVSRPEEGGKSLKLLLISWWQVFSTSHFGPLIKLSKTVFCFDPVFVLIFLNLFSVRVMHAGKKCSVTLA